MWGPGWYFGLEPPDLNQEPHTGIQQCCPAAVPASHAGALSCQAQADDDDDDDDDGGDDDGGDEWCC